MTRLLVCAWLSRHAPTDSQTASLRAYQIVQIQPKHRFWDAQRTWNLAFRAVGGRTPDLMVVVLPETWIADFVEIAHFCAPTLPVLRARMLPPDYEHWSGEWRALFVRNKVLDWYQWKPEVMR